MGEAYQRGLILYRQRRYDLATEEFRRALESSPNDVWSLSMLANSLSRLRKHDEAIAAAESAIAAEPTQYYAHFSLASALMDKHWRRPEQRRWRAPSARDRATYSSNMEKTRGVCAAAIQLNPDHGESLGLLAAIEFNLNRYQVAIESAERALRINPQDTFSANLRSRALLELGRLNAAESSLDQTLAIDPDNARTHANRGWLMMNRDDPESALQDFNEALRIDPHDHLALTGLTAARRKLIWREFLKEHLQRRLLGRPTKLSIIVLVFWLFVNVVAFTDIDHVAGFSIGVLASSIAILIVGLIGIAALLICREVVVASFRMWREKRVRRKRRRMAQPPNPAGNP